jgi:signal transduction histidine kinase
MKRLVWIAVGGVAVGVAAEVTSYATGTRLPDVLRDVCVGWAFLAAGIVAWWRRPQYGTGRLMVAEGFAWFIGNFQGLGLALVFSLSYWFAALNQAVLAHLVLSFPRGRLESRAARLLVLGTYALVVVAGFANMATADPPTGDKPDYLCGSRCPQNALLLVHSQPLAVATNQIYYLGAVAIGIALLAFLVRRWAKASVPERRALLPVWVTGFLLVFIIVGDLGAALPGGESDPVSVAVVWMSDLSQLAIPLAFLLGVLLVQLKRGAVGELVVELGQAPAPAPARLRDALARTLGDRSLELAFWVPEVGGYVTAEGESVTLPEPDGPRAVTLVERHGQPLAAIVYDPALSDDARLVEAAQAAAGIGLENERLHAEIRARLEEVRASRVRILEAGDAERRRVERNLHDGAQQRLISVAFSLQLASAQVQRHPDPALEETIDRARRELQDAVAELRELASGIHPPILVHRGLGPALTSLAESAPLPVIIDAPNRRYPLLVESTAYYVASEGVANAAKHAAASWVEVRVTERGERLVVEVRDEGAGGANLGRGSGLQGLGDRAAALGGRLEVESPPGMGTRLRAELPLQSSPQMPASEEAAPAQDQAL